MHHRKHMSRDRYPASLLARRSDLQKTRLPLLLRVGPCLQRCCLATRCSNQIIYIKAQTLDLYSLTCSNLCKTLLLFKNFLPSLKWVTIYSLVQIFHLHPTTAKHIFIMTKLWPQSTSLKWRRRQKLRLGVLTPSPALKMCRACSFEM
jgi:hypothetical protein